MTLSWKILPTPEQSPPPVLVRHAPYLAASGDDRFPESVPHARESLLRIGPQDPEASLADCGAMVADVVDRCIHDHPAILFKGLPISTREDFSRFFLATGLTPHDYKGGNAIRDKSNDFVSVTSTENAANVISPHNENAYMPEPPDLVLFCCLQAAASGGEVPINDIRKTPALLPEAFVDEMRRRDLRYIRRMRAGDNRFEIGWKTSFATEDKNEINAYLESRNIDYRWRGDTLEFWFNTPAFRRYRGEDLWFNQLSECNADYWLYHVDGPLMGYTRETCQSDTAYGDGAAFAEDIRIMVRAALWQTTEVVKMEASDVLLLDNNIMQHGRMAYRGNRRHLAALARFDEPVADASD